MDSLRNVPEVQTHNILKRKVCENGNGLNAIFVISNLNKTEVWRIIYKNVMAMGLLRFKCDICNEQFKHDKMYEEPPRDESQPEHMSEKP